MKQPAMSLSNQIRNLNLQPEHLAFLREHVGFSGSESSEPKARLGSGILDRKIVRILHTHLSQIADALDVIESNAGRLWNSRNPASHERAAAEIGRILDANGWAETTLLAADQLLIVVRYLIECGQTSLIRWTELSYRIASLAPAQTMHPRVATDLAARAVAPENETELLSPRALSSKPDLGAVLARLNLTDREWTIAEARHGVAERKTLDQLAVELDVTRERVRQIERKAIERIHKCEPELASAFDVMDLTLATLWKPFSDEPYTNLCGIVSDALTEAGFTGANRGTAHTLILSMRMLNQAKLKSRRWPDLSYQVASISPIQKTHPAVAAALKARSRDRINQKRNLSTENIARQVLLQIGEPMHRDKIYKSSLLAFGHVRPDLTPGAIFASLTGHPELFIRIAPGTYALAEWSQNTINPCDDLIASILARKGTPVARSDIQKEVNLYQSAKAHSVAVILDLHPRFYQSVEGRYGLRAWLSKEIQKLEWIPFAFKESDNSRRRLRHDSDLAKAISKDAPLPLKMI